MNTPTIPLRCLNNSTVIEARGGQTLLELASAADFGFRPALARVNNKIEPLLYRVYGPKDVEFLPADSPAGQRARVRSLCMLLFRALTECYPGTRLRIEYSIGGGHYCRLFKGQHATAEAVRRLDSRMHELAARSLPYELHEAPTEEVIEIMRRQGLNDKVRLLGTIDDLYTGYYTLDGVADSYYGPLVPDTSYLGTFGLRPYKEGFLLMGADHNDATQLCKPSSQEKMNEAFRRMLRLNQALDVRNVGELNLAVRRGESAALINVAEAMHVRVIGDIAAEIARRFHDGGARVVLVAGPSSSGKTTFAKRLAVQLATFMLRPQTISLDNYFVDREHTPLDEDGDYDFESLYALDLERFNADLNALIRGEEIQIPYYNFEKGKREHRGERIRLGHNSLLLIEGIHGLNPELTASVDERQKFRVYVSALTTLAIDDHNWVPTTDNRLLRRIVRDWQYRGVSALETIRRWLSVRRGEQRWIFPYQENADAMFNSSLLFELSCIKELADRVLRQVPRNRPEYAQAWRLRKFLSYFLPIEQKAIPPTSLLREFLGGSSFHY